MVSQGFFSGSESAKKDQKILLAKENKVALGGDNLGKRWSYRCSRSV
ncbi:MAG: hypothetical protein CM15mV31_0980 [uncultured marine virus]|nr:MAG: hypothetical protein CM15mV31_0980 [uncultured marine virus]